MELQQPTKQERRESRHQEKMMEQQRRARSRFIKRIILWSSVLIVVGVLIFGIAKFTSAPSSNDLASATTSITDGDWVKGNREASVTVIEYSDFQCPACGAYYPVIKQLVEEFGGNIAFVYRHFPLRQIHQNAELAAYAAEAAGKQNKFWEMHGMIFENQKEWSNERNAKEFFLKYADALDLNKEQFIVDFDSREIKDKINADYQSGLRLNVNATPTFFLNGEKLQNPRNYENFKSLIQGAISQ
ncbi:MAG: thioredoxin domain-containing protein [bacterium]|nr:thioredoxin domain-containing protein [bacterium]